jgi:hypothetical protein
MAFIEGRAYDLSKLADGEELGSNPLMAQAAKGNGRRAAPFTFQTLFVDPPPARVLQKCSAASRVENKIGPRRTSC